MQQGEVCGTWPRSKQGSLLVERTDLPGSSKGPIRGRLNNPSVPRFSHLGDGDEGNSDYFGWS